MAEKPSRRRTSTLASLGIKPNSQPSASPAQQRPTTVRPSPAPAPKQQKASNGSTSTASPGSTRMRSRANTLTNAPSPVSPTPSQRRSIVPASSASRQNAAPLVRRSSNIGSVGTSKRLSSPTGIDLAAEKVLLDKVADLEAQLREKDQALQDSQAKVEALEKDERLLSSSSLLIPYATNEETQLGISRTGVFETEQDSKEVKDNEKITKAAMDKLLEEQEQRFQTEIASLRTDHEQQVRQLTEKSKQERERLEKQHEQEIQKSADQHASVQGALEQQIKELQDSRSSVHLRKLEHQLNEAQSVLAGYEEKAKGTTEKLEERLRAEIRQLQNGSDDAAQAWLEKHRKSQDEIDRLMQNHLLLEEEHQKKIKAKEDKHQEEINTLVTEQKSQEEEIKNQAQEIESLLLQVESLQNAVEAATERRSRTKNEELQTVPLHQNIHNECEEKLQERLDEITKLKASISQLEKNKQQKKLSLPSSPNNDRLIEIVHQHQKELQVLHEQYRNAMDTKDKELENYLYSTKTTQLSRQKEVDELKGKLDRLEKQSKELEQQHHNNREENDQLLRLVNQLQGEIHKGPARSSL